MVKVDRKQVEEALATCHGHGIASMVHVCPGIGTLRQATVGKQVKDTLYTITHKVLT